MPQVMSFTSVYFGNRSISDDLFSFEAVWFPINSYNSSYDKTQSITCDMWQSIYTIDVAYTNGVQHTNSTAQSGRSLPAIALSDNALFYPQAERSSNGALLPLALSKRQELAGAQSRLWRLTAAKSDGTLIFPPSAQAYVWNDTVILPPGVQNISTAYKLSNIHAVHDAIAEALSGSSSPWSQDSIATLDLNIGASIDTSFKIFDRDEPPSFSSIASAPPTEATARPLSSSRNYPSSLLLESAFATFSPLDPSAVNITITAGAIQDLLRNITISLLTIPNTQRTILVTSATTRDVYDFARPLNLILPYAVTLLLSAIVVAIGLKSLYSNGVPATTGAGFIQTFCSTRGSATLNQLAAEAAHRGVGGKGNAAGFQAIGDLKLRYGQLKKGEGEGDGGDSENVMGFGTEGELVSRSQDSKFRRGLLEQNGALQWY